MLRRPLRAALKPLFAGAAVVGIGLVGQAVVTPSAVAKPPATAAFCSIYPSAKACESGTASCATCHTVPPARNLFGAQIEARLSARHQRPFGDDVFMAALPGALKEIEQDDADNDGVTNLAEIMAGSQMADAGSKPLAQACAAPDAAKAAASRWNTCNYDPVYAFKKVSLDFCGVSAKRADVAAIEKIKGDRKAWQAALSAKLDECLDSRYWTGKNGAVWNIANSKIRPAHVVKSGEKAGPVPLGDYDDDYNLFTWANTDDRDVRQLLLADYFVKRVSDAPLKLEVIPEDELAKRPFPTQQRISKDKRAGMISTRWNQASNTMFTPVPRTTAAQAYRAYLGYDISKMEGLMPVNHEPEDFDAKGVKSPECAVCHSTLDPLTYPFTRYNGIGGGYNYDPDRLKGYVRSEGPRIVEAPESGVVLGQPVKDLREWAQVAANSDPFASKVVADYWKVLVGRDASVHGQDKEEFNRLWRDLKNPNAYNYRVEKMLHGLILTNAYGRP